MNLSRRILCMFALCLGVSAIAIADGKKSDVDIRPTPAAIQATNRIVVANEEYVDMTADGSFLIGRTYGADERTIESFYVVAQQDKKIAFDVPKPYDEVDGTNVCMRKMSDAGIVVGVLMDERDTELLPLVWTKSSGYRLLPLPKQDNGSVYGSAVTISKQSDVVGGWYRVGSKKTPCIWKANSDGTWSLTALTNQPLNNVSSEVVGISPKGRYIVGKTPTVIPGVDHKPCYWDLENGGSFHLVPTDGEGRASAANDRGIVVMNVGMDVMLWDIERESFQLIADNSWSDGFIIDNRDYVFGETSGKKACMWAKGKRVWTGEAGTIVLALGTDQCAGFSTPKTGTSRQRMTMPLPEFTKN